MAVGASLGVAVFPSDAGDREALLNNADLAVYRAKGDFAERICYYEPGMDEQARNRRVIANDLRFAAALGELRLLYQPQRSLQSNALVGFEAVLRWAHPTLGGSRQWSSSRLPKRPALHRRGSTWRPPKTR